MIDTRARAWDIISKLVMFLKMDPEQLYKTDKYISEQNFPELKTTGRLRLTYVH